MVNDTLFDGVIVPFSFFPELLDGGKLKKKEYALVGANCFFKSRPYFKSAASSWEENRKSQKLFLSL